jgi:hypothetical protein
LARACFDCSAPKPDAKPGTRCVPHEAAFVKPVSSSPLRLISLATLAAVATGCSVAGSPDSPVSASNTAAIRANVEVADGLMRRESFERAARSHGWTSPQAATGKGLIYWADYDTGTITIYSAKGKNGKKEGSITTGLSHPERLFVDEKGNLYATNFGNDTITAYKPGATSPFLVIRDGVDSPTGLTVDADGTVYCANVGNNTITAYKRGKIVPSLTISFTNTPAYPEYLATDKSDNLYASVGSEVVEFPKGSTSGTNLGLDISSPAGLEVDKSGNVIVADGNSTINYFPPGAMKPSKKISASGAFALSLSKDEKELYVSRIKFGSDFIIQSVAYPNGSILVDKLTTNAGDWPLAVSPDNALGS